MFRIITVALSGLLLGSLISCSTHQKKESTVEPVAADENLWLEEVKGDKALKWVEERNKLTFDQLMHQPTYASNSAEIKKITYAKDRLPYVVERGNYLYNFWQDEKHERGVWRRTTLESFASKSPKWDIILDIDALAKKENENWVFKGSSCLPPANERCILTFSRGGGDASVKREFDIAKRTFVTNGFNLPEAKSGLSWVDENTMLVGTDFGPDSRTNSGYPRQIRLWKRGQPLAEAKLIKEGEKTDVSVQGYTLFTEKGHQMYVERAIDFYRNETWAVSPTGELTKIQKPLDANFAAAMDGQLILSLRTAWKDFPAGALVAIDPNGKQEPELVFAPDARQSIAGVDRTKDALIVTLLDKIQGKALRFTRSENKWHSQPLPFPEKGELSVYSVNAFSTRVLVSFNGFLTPPSIISADVSTKFKTSDIKTRVLKSLPSRFADKNFEAEQLWAKSKDGTEVPYFIVHKKNLVYNGQTPTLIEGYGGFEISNTPTYLTVAGKLWLEKGGAYVVANIRGGGEFGPKWHSAALKENRQKAYDDFIAVAEDVHARKIASPATTAIMGGSNGGLLVGATFVQRPDLYRAVVCEVPLLDMLRYNKLLAGASWEGEYGNPEDPSIRAAILKYSPYQNVKAGVKYPEVFFVTSTMDDRVHPGHARKMVARMLAQGHQPLYFENTEGGHGAAANLEQSVKLRALTYTFLQTRLMGPSKTLAHQTED